MKEYKEIIEYAIKREIEAETFYKDIVQKVSQPILKVLFADFASEENKHQQILKGILENREIELHFKQTSDYGISQTVAKPEISDGMKLADVFAVAMKNEENAMTMYQALAADSSSKSVQKLFEELALMEQGHKFKMEQFYTDVAYSETW